MGGEKSWNLRRERVVLEEREGGNRGLGSTYVKGKKGMITYT